MFYQSSPYQSDIYGVYYDQPYRYRIRGRNAYYFYFLISGAFCCIFIITSLVVTIVPLVLFLKTSNAISDASQNYEPIQQITQFTKSVKIPEQKNCGKPQLSPSINGSTLNRIINGQEAVPNSWPWMVSLRVIYSSNSLSNHFCGGVLIFPQYVLTAAHCLEAAKGYSLGVVVGLDNVQSAVSTSNLYHASTYAINSAYNSEITRNDVGLIKLANAVNESATVSIICLPSSSNDGSDVNNKNVVLIGWGSKDGYQNKSSFPYKLQQTVLKVHGNESVCYDQYEDFDFNSQYCALADSRNTNVCYGDSGGPLMYYKNESWYTYGICSTGIVANNVTNNCNQSQPSYTQVAKYLDWIGDAMANL